MVPWENRLSVTVGTLDVPDTVPIQSRVNMGVISECKGNLPEVRSTGPIPRIPSTSLNPWAVEATPMDWF